MCVRDSHGKSRAHAHTNDITYRTVPRAYTLTRCRTCTRGDCCMCVSAMREQRACLYVSFVRIAIGAPPNGPLLVIHIAFSRSRVSARVFRETGFRLEANHRGSQPVGQFTRLIGAPLVRALVHSHPSIHPSARPPARPPRLLARSPRSLARLLARPPVAAFVRCVHCRGSAASHCVRLSLVDVCVEVTAESRATILFYVLPTAFARNSLFAMFAG